MFTFSNEYLLKSMWASVRDEGDRIVSLGLATYGDLKGLIDPAMHVAIKQATNGVKDDSVMLRTLSILYDNLKSVSLPGDFEKFAKTDSEKMHDMLGVPVPNDQDVDVESEVEEVKEEIEDQGDAFEDNVAVVYSTLENIAYKLGRDGNHKEAYLIEKTIRAIENLVAQGKS